MKPQTSDPAPNILLVDDDDSNRFILSAVLEDEGYRVDIADSLATAIQKLAPGGSPYTVALIDWQLGDGTGAQLLPHVRARIPQPRTVLMTGYTTEADHDGFDVALLKGESVDQLLAVIKRLCQASTTTIHDKS